jgi:cyclophilin family peptidyl-prolyl cis-trans isomerase
MKPSLLGVVGAVSVVLSAAAPVIAQSTAKKPAPSAAQRHAALLDPKSAFWSVHAPAIVTADIETSRGVITIELVREWAPIGVDHFYNLARAGYYDDTRFYRVLMGFVAQFGIARDPALANFWGAQTIRADSVRTSNVRGTISYAQFKPTDRTTNVFINLHDNLNLDTLKFAPIGRVVQGMDIADSLYFLYGERPISEPPLGDVKRLYRETNKYMDKEYPKLDRILKITIRPDSTR